MLLVQKKVSLPHSHLLHLPRWHCQNIILPNIDNNFLYKVSLTIVMWTFILMSKQHKLSFPFSWSFPPSLPNNHTIHPHSTHPHQKYRYQLLQFHRITLIYCHHHYNTLSTTTTTTISQNWLPNKALLQISALRPSALIRKKLVMNHIRCVEW